MSGGGAMVTMLGSLRAGQPTNTAVTRKAFAMAMILKTSDRTFMILPPAIECRRKIAAAKGAVNTTWVWSNKSLFPLNLHRHTANVVVLQPDSAGVGAHANADTLLGAARLLDGIVSNGHIRCLALDINSNAILGTAVDDAIVLQEIAIGSESRSSFGTEEHADPAAAAHLVVADDIVPIPVAEGNAVAAIVNHAVILRESVPDAPAEKKPNVVAFHQIVPD